MKLGILIDRFHQKILYELVQAQENFRQLEQVRFLREENYKAYREKRRRELLDMGFLTPKNF